MHRPDEQPQGVDARHDDAREGDHRDHELGFEDAQQDQELADEVRGAGHRKRGERHEQEDRREHWRAEGDAAHLAHVLRAARALGEQRDDEQQRRDDEPVVDDLQEGALRPLRVQSADLVDLMNGFAERYRNESVIALDVLIDSAEIHAPDRVCREIFQIYREALNNIKKHAKASHVVVKLSQDDSALVLVVDDNGEGFSFAGRFTGDELDRLRLGPISIKERARTVGGILTVESNPGHGARLIVEIPLG